MELFPNLALAWSLSDQTAESEVTVGCARLVNPLKLNQTLSTLNFRTCDHEKTPIKRKYVGFLRRSTKGKEVSD